MVGKYQANPKGHFFSDTPCIADICLLALDVLDIWYAHNPLRHYWEKPNVWLRYAWDIQRIQPIYSSNEAEVYQRHTLDMPKI